MKMLKKSNKTSKVNPLLAVGLLINSGLILINRTIVEIPDALYISISLVAIALMISSIYLSKRQRMNKEDNIDDGEK